MREYYGGTRYIPHRCAWILSSLALDSVQFLAIIRFVEALHDLLLIGETEIDLEQQNQHLQR